MLRFARWLRQLRIEMNRGWFRLAIERHDYQEAHRLAVLIDDLERTKP